MSDITTIRPPAIAVAAEASAGHRLLGSARRDVAQAPMAPKQPLVSHQRRSGQFGAAPGVQINRRGEAPVTKIAPQTLQVMTSTLTGLIRFCLQQDASQAAATASRALDLVRAIAAGEPIADPPRAPVAPPPTATPVTPPSSTTP